VPVHGADGGEWEIATSRSQRWEAEMIQGFLESHGIRTWLQSFDGSAAAHPGAGAQNVLVPVEELEAARELLETGVESSDEPDRQVDVDLESSDDERLSERLLELLAIPSVTGDEGAIAEHLEAWYEGAGVTVRRVGRSLVIGDIDRSRPLVLLVGHLDTVPPTDRDVDPRVEGDDVVGRGASDMKGGLAVALDCFDDQALREGTRNLLVVAYAGEEGPHETNELGAVLAEIPELARADLAIVLEPTDLTVQLGCLGTLHADVTFHGSAAHSARPWLGENALTKAGEFLAELHGRAPLDDEVDGLTYREVFTATTAHTANARNVVPDTFTVNLNYRFSPAKTLRQAEEDVLALVDGRADVVITDRAPAAAPRRDAPEVAAFVASVGAPLEPKQAWTDVARLDAAGVPALNYGPGVAAQAHQAGEYVPAANLVAARQALARFLSA
jgi:succinyl-diaminopimelate desuccinylase